ncbi:hypothetical protein HYW21_05970 [Candidatus Woesearchaeota archaeon]|nr:hypothetical protein [Candidatus Woesearchaeota archaeon]
MSPQTTIADKERESYGSLHLPTIDTHIRAILTEAERQYGRRPSFVVAEGTPHETEFFSKYIAFDETLPYFLCSDSIVGATEAILQEVAPSVDQRYTPAEVELLRYGIGGAIVGHGFKELKTSPSFFIRHPLEVFHLLYRLGIVDYTGRPQPAQLALLLGGLNHDFPEETTKTTIRDQMLRDGHYAWREKPSGNKLIPQHWWKIPETDRQRYEQQSRHSVYTTLQTLMNSLEGCLDSPRIRADGVQFSDSERAALRDEIRKIGPIVDLETAPHSMNYFAYGGRLFDSGKHRLAMGESASDVYSFPSTEYTPAIHRDAQMIKFIDRARNTRTMRTTYTGRQPNGDAFDEVRQLFNFFKNIYLLGLAKGCYQARAAVIQRDFSRLSEIPHYRELLEASLDTLDQFLKREENHTSWPRRVMYQHALSAYEDAGGLNGLTTQGETAERMGIYRYFGDHFDGILGAFSVIALDFARNPPRVEVRHQRYKMALAFYRILERIRDDHWYVPQFTFTTDQARHIHDSSQ